MFQKLIPNALANEFSILPGDNTTGAGVGLADKIRSGEIQLSDIPQFISFFIEMAIILAGIVAFIMIIVGGYQYIVGGVYSDMREQGKNTLIYAIGGLVLSLLAYGIVNLVQIAATSF